MAAQDRGLGITPGSGNGCVWGQVGVVKPFLSQAPPPDSTSPPSPRPPPPTEAEGRDRRCVCSNRLLRDSRGEVRGPAGDPGKLPQWLPEDVTCHE